MANFQEIIWVTGGSSGIGRELCLRLAQQGHRVIASGRNESRLQALQREHSGIVILPFDVTDRGRISAVQQQLMGMVNRLDRVFLNAGDCEYFDLASGNWQSIEKMVSVNFLGMVNSVQIGLPLLERSTRGHIVGIGSQAVLAPFPRAEGYGASKAAVSYFLAALRIDLSAKGIDVTEVQPGFVDTPLTQRNDFPMPFMVSAEEAAKRILSAVERRPMQYVFPKRLQWLLKLSRWMPGLWLKMHARQQHNHKITNDRRSKRA